MNRLLPLLYVFFLSFLFTPKAHAYLDPGTGSMLLQALVAGAVAILVFGKRIWIGLSGLFAKRGTTDTTSTEEKSE